MKFFILASLLLVISCGKSKSNESVEVVNKVVPDTCDQKLDSKVIIDDLYWYDYSDAKNRDEYLNSKTVGQLSIPSKRSRCTAFIINKNTIMTNNHCVNSTAQAQNVTFKVRDKGGPQVSYSCSKFIMTNRTLDFTLLKCDKNVGEIYGYNALSSMSIDLYDDIYIIQENCDYTSNSNCSINKMIAHGNIEQTGKYVIGHNADTLGGSSGSPIFSEDSNKVVAIHNAGSTYNARNYGVPMDEIISKIKEERPDVKIFNKRVQGSNNNSQCE